MRIKLAHPSVGLYVLTHNVTLGITKASRGSRRDVILKSNEARKHSNRKTLFLFSFSCRPVVDRPIYLNSELCTEYCTDSNEGSLFSFQMSVRANSALFKILS